MSGPHSGAVFAVRAYQTRYPGFDNDKRPKGEFIEKIAKMSDDDLFEATKNGLWLSVFANNNPRSDFHWQAEVFYDEWQHRERRDQYTAAYEAAAKAARRYRQAKETNQ